jgi:hypothetical protein
MLAKKGGGKREGGGAPAQFADWMFEIYLKFNKVTQQYMIV